MRKFSFKYLYLSLLLRLVISEGVSDLTQSQLPGTNLISVEECNKFVIEENIKQIVDLRIPEIYLKNIENENVSELNNESEPDISRLVAVRIPIINLSDSHSPTRLTSKNVITQAPETNSSDSSLILPVLSPLQEAQKDISPLVEVKIPIINLPETGGSNTTTTPRADSSVPILPVQLPPGISAHGFST